MSEKILKGRSVQKHDTEANWLKATNFIPKQGEIIIYDIDSTHTNERMKIGDGKTVVSSLPFIEANKATEANHAISANSATKATQDASGNVITTTYETKIDATSKLNTAKGYTDEKISAITPASIGAATAKSVSDLDAKIGDTAVATQIESAVSGKANTSDLTSHTGNTTVHITSAERTKWNAAKSHADSDHAPSNAEPNQNAFSNVTVGSTTITAESKTDTLTLAGSNVTLTPDATNDKITIGITKDNVTAALGYTPPTTNTTYNAADSSLGLVKSGGDVTITDGVITVNDDSHAHVISNVDGLQSALDAKATVSALSAISGLVGDTAVSTQIETAIASKADTGHTHDDIYYTESEINTKLAGKSDTSHTHSAYVNQNAFSNVKVGSTTVAADTTTDTLELVAGSNVTITPDATNDKITIAATDTTYSDMKGATSSAVGTHGLVPAPAKGKQTSFLRGDGTWVVPTNTVTTATTSGSGNAVTSVTASNGALTVTKGETFATKAQLDTVSGLVGDTAVATQIENAVSAITPASIGAAESSHTHNYAGSSSAGGAATSANKVNKSLTVKLNSGTTEGTNMFTFDGSTAKSVDITPSAIGAAKSSHGTHVTWSTTTPKANGTAAVGSETKVARGDHVHPTDTTRAAASDVAALQGIIYQDSEDHINIDRKSEDYMESNLKITGRDIIFTDYAMDEYPIIDTLNNKSDKGHKHAATDITSGILAVAMGGTGNSTGYVQIGAKVGSDIGTSATAEGKYTVASGDYSHAEGYLTEAIGTASHAEGSNSVASGTYSHAEGKDTEASGLYSHAEGDSTTASGANSHAEGWGTITSGTNSHAEGYLTQASYNNAHAEGSNTIASSYSSHAEGESTIAASLCQHVQGQFNIEDTAGAFAHIVGNGTADNARSNAHTLDWDGNAWYAGHVYAAGNLGAAGDIYIDNNKHIFSKFADGTNNIMMWANPSDQMGFGYGGYTSGKGTTYFDGNTVWIRSNNGINAGTNGGNIQLAVSAGNDIRLAGGDYGLFLRDQSSGNYAYKTLFMPSHDTACTLGAGSVRFYRLYASLACTTTSDEREKSDIMSIADYPTMYSANSEGNIFEQLFYKLTPKTYTLNVDTTGDLHIGFIAQDIVKSCDELGLNATDLGLINHDSWTDEETGEEKDRYGLAYEEFTALNTYIIQKQQDEIKSLKERVAKLEQLITAN